MPTTYSLNDFTYGLELEYADVNRLQELPPGFAWNTRDFSIVNSSGIANDPKGELWPWGGEINTPPTPSIREQLEAVTRLYATLSPAPVINYRCNLHVHLGVPGLRDDLSALKRVARYIHRYAKEAFKLIEPIPKPLRIHYRSAAAFAGAMKRYRRRHRSHQYMVPEARLEEMLAATTPEEFYLAHAPLTPKGRMWYFAPRAGINLRPLWKTGTVEFRHFPGTLDLDELGSAMTWCREFLYAALVTGKPPAEILRDTPGLLFPRFAPYQHDLEVLYACTNLEHNSRAAVRLFLDELARIQLIPTP